MQAFKLAHFANSAARRVEASFGAILAAEGAHDREQQRNVTPAPRWQVRLSAAKLNHHQQRQQQERGRKDGRFPLQPS